MRFKKGDKVKVLRFRFSKTSEPETEHDMVGRVYEIEKDLYVSYHLKGTKQGFLHDDLELVQKAETTIKAEEEKPKKFGTNPVVGENTFHDPPTRQQPESVEELSAEEVEKWFRKHYVQDNALNDESPLWSYEQIYHMTKMYATQAVEKSTRQVDELKQTLSLAESHIKMIENNKSNDLNKIANWLDDQGFQAPSNDLYNDLEFLTTNKQ